MCGIVGYAGHQSAMPILLEGLHRLEYRGYDSAGLALFVSDVIDPIWLARAEGRLSHLETLVQQEPPPGQPTVGMGHTRWATHGAATLRNAHPHRVKHIAVVHNGIIENYATLHQKVVELGHPPRSETDSELFAILLAQATGAGEDYLTALVDCLRQIEGQCSFVIMNAQAPEVLVGVRLGSPLVVSEDLDWGIQIASDAQALSRNDAPVRFLEWGDIAWCTPHDVKVLSVTHLLQTPQPSEPLSAPIVVSRPEIRLGLHAEALGRGGYPHYMLKEIHEQPEALLRTLEAWSEKEGEWIRRLADWRSGDAVQLDARDFRLRHVPGLQILAGARELVLVACGTSWNAAQVARYWFEELAGLPVSVEYASEFRYRRPVIRPGSVILGISQSGETADTLAVMREMRAQNRPTLGLCNVPESSLSREVDAMFHSQAGPEIGVAATKTFLTQLLALLLLALHRCAEPSLSLLSELYRLPHLLERALRATDGLDMQMAALIQRLQERGGEAPHGFFFMGRGTSYPLALEGALKLKEVAYDHAEGYPAGELKHGPIAMIDSGMVVVVLAPGDSWRAKTVSNLEEVRARGAIIVGVGEASDRHLRTICHEWVALPEHTHRCGPLPEALWPFLLAPVLQLFSYHRGIQKGTAVDRPRNLAKSVTVE